MPELRQEVAKQSLGQILPVSVLTGTIAGIPISSVVLWLTLVYLIAQIVVILPKAWTAIKSFKRG